MHRLINNYGLFWRRSDVFWGKPNNSGRLLGVPTGGKTSNPVNFRNQAGVYVLYDDNFKVVYVGQAGSGNQHLFTRLKRHTKDSLADRWTRFSWFGIKPVKKNGELGVGASFAHVPKRDILNHVEAILISAAEPPHNRQGGRFGYDIEQFLQYRDKEALGPDTETMIKKLWKSAAASSK
jgi:hypothetical protein